MGYLRRLGSTLDEIEQLLATGQVEKANNILGRPFRVAAEVIHGAKLGRTLGFPTANMNLPPSIQLLPGIYAVMFTDGAGREARGGVASFGRRPTVTENGTLLLETFVFDFSADLYGQVCTVEFVKFLRPEMKFESIEALTDQMQLDESDARTFLATWRNSNRTVLNVNAEECFVEI